VKRRLLGSYLTLTVIVLLILEIPLGLRFADHERDQLTTQIERDAVVVGSLVEDSLQEGAVPLPTALIGRYARESGTRIVVLDGNGRAVVDTTGAAGVGRSLAARPEVRAALAGRVSDGSERSDSTGTDVLYVAVPVASAGSVFGAVRVTSPASALDARIAHYWFVLGGIGAVTLLLATIVGLLLARSVTGPLGRVEHATAAFGGGELSARVGAPGGPPIVRSLARSFDDMAARLEELVVAQDAFVADASHQLRNPLLALRLRLENLLADVDGESGDDLRRALDEVARLSRTVDGLLALARADRGAPGAPTVPVDVVPIVRARCDEWSALADERDVALVLDVPAQPVRAVVTPDRLAQVLDNLLANAVDVAPRSSRVTLAARERGGVAEVHVIDEGRGMSDVERQHAFDRFWRSSSPPTSSLGGSGLGLSIVRKLVAADGGSVELGPGPAGGVDAVVRLRRP
jgi:signal transduction histidine kinase